MYHVHLLLPFLHQKCCLFFIEGQDREIASVYGMMVLRLQPLRESGYGPVIEGLGLGINVHQVRIFPVWDKWKKREGPGEGRWIVLACTYQE